MEERGVTARRCPQRVAQRVGACRGGAARESLSVHQEPPSEQVDEAIERYELDGVSRFALAGAVTEMGGGAQGAQWDDAAGLRQCGFRTTSRHTSDENGRPPSVRGDGNETFFDDLTPASSPKSSSISHQAHVVSTSPHASNYSQAREKPSDQHKKIPQNAWIRSPTASTTFKAQALNYTPPPNGYVSAAAPGSPQASPLLGSDELFRCHLHRAEPSHS